MNKIPQDEFVLAMQRIKKLEVVIDDALATFQHIIDSAAASGEDVSYVKALYACQTIKAALKE